MCSKMCFIGKKCYRHINKQTVTLFISIEVERRESKSLYVLVEVTFVCDDQLYFTDSNLAQLRLRVWEDKSWFLIGWELSKSRDSVLFLFFIEIQSKRNKESTNNK